MIDPRIEVVTVCCERGCGREIVEYRAPTDDRRGRVRCHLCLRDWWWQRVRRALWARKDVH